MTPPEAGAQAPATQSASYGPPPSVPQLPAAVRINPPREGAESPVGAQWFPSPRVSFGLHRAAATWSRCQITDDEG